MLMIERWRAWIFLYWAYLARLLVVMASNPRLELHLPSSSSSNNGGEEEAWGVCVGEDDGVYGGVGGMNEWIVMVARAFVVRGRHNISGGTSTIHFHDPRVKNTL